MLYKLIKFFIYIIMLLIIFLLYNANKKNINNKEIDFNYFKIMRSDNINDNKTLKFYCKKLISKSDKKSTCKNMSNIYLHKLYKKKLNFKKYEYISKELKKIKKYDNKY